MLRLTVLALLLLPGSTDAVSRGQQTPVYAVLPLQDASASVGAADRMQANLRAVLEVRGARFVPEQDLESILRARRIRYTDSVSRADAQAIGSGTGAGYLITGTLLDHVGAPSPAISLAVRVLDCQSGARILSSLTTLTGEDFRGLLGLGVIEDPDELESEVLARVLDDFDDDGSPIRPEGSRLASRPRGVMSTFRSEDFDPQDLRRVAVLPLINRTRRLEAVPIFGETLAHSWFQAGVEVVELSELRAALIRLRVRSLDYLDEDLFAQLAEELGTRYFVLGSIDVFEETRVRNHIYPLVEASVRVLDASERRLVAAVSLRRRGDAYHVLLGLGSVRDPIPLIERVAGEMIALILR